MRRARRPLERPACRPSRGARGLRRTRQAGQFQVGRGLPGSSSGRRAGISLAPRFIRRHERAGEAAREAKDKGTFAI